MKQLLAMLRNAIKENDEKDVRLFQNILIRSIKDVVVLELDPEVQEALELSHEFLQNAELNAYILPPDFY
jgi:hypothetical protein